MTRKNTLAFGNIDLPAIWVLAGIIAGLVGGYTLGWAVFRSDSGSQQNSSLFFSDSTVLTQRTLVAKGEIKDIINQTLVLVPAGVDADEQNRNKISLSTNDKTNVYLYLESVQSAQKVVLSDLKPGDEVDVVMSQTVEGVVSVSSVTAIRTN